MGGVRCAVGGGRWAVGCGCGGGGGCERWAGGGDFAIWVLFLNSLMEIGGMKKFRTLELAHSLYEETVELKFKKVHFQDQYDRALLSIVLNLSEGSGRRTAKDRRRFYFMSYSSLKEVQTILRLNRIDKFDSKFDTLAAHLYQLTKNPGGH